jgi:hypothetical protein
MNTLLKLSVPILNIAAEMYDGVALPRRDKFLWKYFMCLLDFSLPGNVGYRR